MALLGAGYVALGCVGFNYKFMKSFSENPDGEQNQKAARQNEREIFALKQQSKMEQLKCIHGVALATSCGFCDTKSEDEAD